MLVHTVWIIVLYTCGNSEVNVASESSGVDCMFVCVSKDARALLNDYIPPI